MRRGSHRLKALATIRGLGYVVSYPTLDFAGQCVYFLSNDEEKFHALIQTRSFVETGYRYWIGIVIPDLRKVDQFIGWFERESKLVKLPARLLCTILDEREALGDASYADEGRQWSVYFHLNEGTLSPSGSRGKRYNIAQYFVPVPRQSRPGRTDPGQNN
jgi:hypothetical protein